MTAVAGACRTLGALVSAGVPLPVAAVHVGALPSGPERTLAEAALRVARESGAPLAAALARLADTLEAAENAAREVQIAFAGPKATAKLVGVLPLVGLLLGACLGFDTVRVLFATPPGWVCLALGAGLMYASRRWSAALIAHAQPAEAAPGFALELVAMGMAGGASLERACALAESARPARPAEQVAVADALAIARETGAPVAALLRAHAELLRRRADAAARQAAAAVAVKLMIPLAACVLPAFMVLGVVPVLIAMFAASPL